MQLSASIAIAVAAVAQVTQAHMNMDWPPPLKYKGNPFAGQDIDYSYTSPLNTDGSNYPCKGYQSLLGTTAGSVVATLAAGQQYNATITGGANHGGGSCQLSLSYDSGKTFTVIHSYIGGCPAAGTSQLDFTVPSDAPSASTALLAWSWNNEIGNREFYMNCAAVSITGGAAKRSESELEGRASTAFADRPAIFTANMGAVSNNVCTAEGADVKYPNPGPDVTTASGATLEDPGTSATAGQCPAAGSTTNSGTGSGTGTGSGVSSAAGASPAAASTSAAAATSAASVPGGVFVTTPAGAAATTAPVTTAVPTTLATQTVVAASSAVVSSAGSTSSSTASASGNTPGTACSSEGEYVCVGNEFQRCASGQWSQMMALAAGTSCTPGVGATLDMVASRFARRGRMAAGWKA